MSLFGERLFVVRFERLPFLCLSSFRPKVDPDRRRRANAGGDEGDQIQSALEVRVGSVGRGVGLPRTRPSAGVQRVGRRVAARVRLLLRGRTGHR